DDRNALTHDEEVRRHGADVSGLGQLVGGLERDGQAVALELARRRAEDLGVVGLAPGRVRELPVDAPALDSAAHRAPLTPALSRTEREEAASASASARSSMRSTSITFGMSTASIGSPDFASQARKSRRRPRSPGMPRRRIFSGKT